MSSYNSYINDYYTSVKDFTSTNNNVVFTGATINQELGAALSLAESKWYTNYSWRPYYNLLKVNKNDAMVTVGGVTYGYNFSYKGTNIQGAVDVIKYASNGYLNFTAHTGGNIQGTNAEDANSVIKDSSIKIIGSNNYNVREQTVLLGVKASQDVSITGVTAQKLTVISDMSATVDVDSTISQISGWVVASTDSEGKDTSTYTDMGSSNSAVASAMKVSAVEFKNNFTGTLDAAGSIKAYGYVTPVVNSNVIGGYGINSTGAVELLNGYWGGSINVSASGSSLLGDQAECKDGKSTLTTASVNSNTMTAVGVQASNVAVKKFTGSITAKADSNNMKAAANGNKTEVTESNGVTTSKETVTASTGTVSGNKITAAGVNAAQAIDIQEVAGVINVSANSNKFAASASSKQVSTGSSESGSTTTTKPTPTTCSASVSNNTISVNGISAGGALNISDFDGSVSAAANDTSFTANGTSDEGTVAISNNTISVYGIIAGGALTVGEFGGSVSAVANNTSFTAAGNGAQNTVSISGNKFDVAAIQAAGITVTNDFTANVSAGASKITSKQNGNYTGPIVTSDPIRNNTINVYGIHVNGNLIVQGNMAGSVNVSVSGWSGDILDDSALAKNDHTVGAIRADSIQVGGYLATNISASMGTNITKVGGIATGVISAKAFTGSVSANIAMVVSVGMQSTEDDVFDIAGDIYGYMTGMYGFASGMKLRVSGSVKVSDDIYGYGPSMGYKSYSILAGGYSATDDPSLTDKNDFLEIAAGATIKGNIDLTNGENTILIDSNARVTGGILSTAGKVNLTFMLNDKAMGDAANATSSGNTVLRIDQDGQELVSTASVAINLNDVVLENGRKTYYLAKDSVSGWEDRQIAFVYQNLMKWTKVGEKVVVDGAFTVSSQYSNGVFSVTVESLSDLGENYAALKNVTGTMNAETGVLDITWDPVAAVAKYEVEYSIDGDKTITVMVDGKLNKFVLDGIKDGQIVEYRVRAHYTEYRSFSDWSEVDSQVCQKDSVVPDTENLISTENFSCNVANTEIDTLTSSAVVTLSWSGFECVEGLKYYEVRYYSSAEECNNLDWDTLAYGSTENYYHKYTTANELLISGLNDSEFLYWQIRCIDNKGNVSEWMDINALKMIADTIAPEMHDVKEMVTYDATYTKNPAEIGFITATLNWEAATDNDGGSGVRDYTVKYRPAGESEWTTVVLTNETFTFSVELANGDYEWEIYATDYAEHVSNVASGEWKGDHAAPVAINEMSYTTVYNTGNDPLDLDVTIYWDPAEDYDDSDRAGSQVKEYLVYRKTADETEWTLMETVAHVIGQTDQYSYAVKNDANLDYEWKVVVVDYAGNKNEDFKGTSYGDHVAPAMAGEVAYKTVYLTDDAATTPCDITVTLNWEAASDLDCAGLTGSGIKGYAISYREDANSDWIFVDNVGKDKLSFTMQMANGDYQWKVQAFDYALNYSDGLTVDSYGDHVAPDMAGDLSAKTTYICVPGAEEPCDITVTLNWEAASDLDCAGLTGSGVRGYVISCRISEDAEWEVVGNVDNKTFTFSSQMANGDYQWKVQAFDYAFNVSTGEEIWSYGDLGDVRVEDKPVISGEIAVDSFIYRRDTWSAKDPKTSCLIDLSVSWNAASDEKSGVKSYNIYYRELEGEWILLDNVTVADVTGKNGKCTYKYDGVLSADTDYELKIDAIDYANNVVEENTGIIGSHDGDAVAPKFSSEKTKWVAIWDNAAKNFVVSGQWADAADTASGLAGYLISYRDIRNGETGSKWVSAGTTEATFAIKNGDYEWTVEAIDYAGNATEIKGEENWHGDVLPPLFGDRSYVYSKVNKKSNGTFIDFEWSAAHEQEGLNKTGVSHYVLTIVADLNGDGNPEKIYSQVIKGQFNTNTTINAAACGIDLSRDAQYGWVVEAYDFGGNKSTSEVGSFIIDNTPPTGAFDKANDTSLNCTWSTRVESEGGMASDTVSYISNIQLSCDWSARFSDAISPVRYEVQICDSDTFYGKNLKSYYTDDTSIVFSNGSNGTFKAGELLGMKKLYWRVRAVDASGNASDIWFLGNNGEALNLYDKNHLDDEGDPSRIHDNTAPVVSGSATIKPDGDGGAQIGWSSAQDAFGVKEYRVQLTRSQAFGTSDNVQEYFSINPEFSNVANISKTSSKTYSITTDSGNNYIVLQGLPDGVYSVSVKAIDFGGNGSEMVKLADAIVVDTTAPWLDMASISSKVAVNDVIFSWKSAYDAIGVDHYVLSYKKFNSEGGFEWVQNIKLDSKATSFQLNNLEVGKYCFTLQAFDAKGHASEVFGYVYDETNVSKESIFTIENSDAGNSMAAAKAMVSGKVYEDAVNYVDNKDYYALTLTSAADVDVKLGNITTLGKTSGGVYLELFNAAGKRIKRVAVAKGSKSYSYLLNAGKYYLCVSPAKKNTSVSYTIQADADLFPAATTNDTSAHFKQNKLTAAVMQDNAGMGALKLDGWVGFGDGEDYMAVKAADAAYTTIRVTGITAKSTVVLYDANKKKVKSLTMSADGTLYSGYLGSNYYLSVTSGDKGKGKFNTDYSFDINAAYVRKDTIANNTKEQAAANAKALSVSNKLDGWVGVGDVADIYKFTNGSGESLSFKVSGVSGKLKLTVYDSNYKRIKSVTVSKDGNYLNDLLVKGDFYVEVASADKGKKQHSNYDITVNAEIFPVEAVANNSRNAAADLTKAGKAGVVQAWDGAEAMVEDWVGFGDKSDYFAFEMKSEGKIDFDLTLDDTSLKAGKDIKVTLFDAAGKKVSLDSELVSRNDLEIGKYFVAVETGNEKKNISGYKLDMSIC